MDPLLTEYTDLYKTAFAEVTGPLGIAKHAGIQSWAQRELPTVGRMARRAGDYLLGGADDAMTQMRQLGKAEIDAAEAARQLQKQKGRVQGVRPGLDEALGSAGLSPTQTRAMPSVGGPSGSPVGAPVRGGAPAQPFAGPAGASEAATMATDAVGAGAGGATQALPAVEAAQLQRMAAPPSEALTTPAASAVGDAAGAAGAAAPDAAGGGSALRNAFLGGTGVAGAGLAGHQYGTMKEQERGARNRNLAFGAGAAAGVAAPGLVQNIGHTLQGLGGLVGPRAPGGGRAATAPRMQAQRPGGLSPQQSMMLRQRGY